MNFKMISAVVLKTLGLSKFIKNDQGTLDLSDEHRNTLSGVFGKDFVAKFAEELAKQNEPTTADSPQALEDSGNVLMDLLNAHHANVIAKELTTVKDQLNAAHEMIATLSKKPEDDPKAEFPEDMRRKADVKSVMKIDYTNPFYAAASEFLKSGNPYAFSATTIEVGQLLTEFGKYLSQNGNNLETFNMIYTGFSSAKYFTVKRALTEWRATQDLITSVVQQFSAKWTPGGKAKFTPLKIQNFRHKINYPIIPAEVLESYMFHLYDEGLAPDQMPITRYIINTLLLPATERDFEMRMIWKAKFVDRAESQNPDEAKAPEDAMNGIETILVDQKASGTSKINFFKHPAFENFDIKTCTDDQILNLVATFVGWFSPQYRRLGMPVMCSHEFWLRYRVAYKNKWGTGSGQAGDFGTDKIDYSNSMLVVPDGMYGSPILFSTPKANLIMLRHKNEVPNIINDVQKHDYEVRVYGEFWTGVGFAIAEGVFAYVPDGYDPKEQINASWGEFNDYNQFKLEQFGSGSESAGA